MELYNFVHLAYIISLLLSFTLFLVVYFRDRKNIVNKIFALDILSACIWLFTVLMADTSKIYRWALFWSKTAVIGPIFILYFLLLFSFVFPKNQKKLPTLIKSILLFLPGLVLILLSPTSLNVKSVKIEPWGAALETGILYPLLFLYIAIYVGMALYNFINSYKKADRTQKYQISYVLSGILISLFISVFTNLILVMVGHSEYSIFGPPSTIFFIIFTTYAILKHHLFEIKVILVESLVAIIALILFVQALISDSLLARILNWSVFSLFCVFGYYLIKATIEEIKRREEIEKISKELQKTYKDLKKLDEAKTEFISIASHQLRTPLTAIKGYISLINEKIYGRPPKRMKKPLENIYLSTERLIKLVADLLNISRIEAGKIKLNIAKLKLEDIIDSVVDELKNLAKEKKLYLKWEKPKTPLPKVLADKDRIRQVVLNVVDNGIRYTERGGVTIRYRKGNKISKLIVSDTGEGMKKKEMLNLFRSFTRGSIGQRTWTEGTGLGLYIAKKFLDLHKGKIWAKSPGKGKGSTFYIELPTE